ncbi:fasciclin domain-containing protein [Brevundimonas sp. 2R-24]|uniref:Fasciclin domain-containing protein n=1 Tax=Peiella sedimenti TaxID=3061083 RepID=A0ABT8SLT1_9CAUL|nr:fasciclin domain-containing protein [Caulobacteraceae bacterium XZ-24]
MKTSLRPAALPALTLSVLTLALSACGDRDGDAAAGPATPPEASRTLADELGEGRATLGRVVESSGLATVLDGVGPYTVLAPTDAAFGQGGADLTEAGMRAQAAALLRAHMLPGAVTREDILAAIDSGGGQASMRNMGGGVVTFTRDGDAIVAAGPDGVSARLTDEEEPTGNGVIQPIDGLLIAPEPS